MKLQDKFLLSDLDAFSREFADNSPEDILRWAWQTFGSGVVMSSSFQTQSVPLLHMISRVCPEMAVVFIDTGLHFPETLAFRDELQERFGLHLKVIRPEFGPEENDDQMYRDDPDRCCYIRKVRCMYTFLHNDEIGAWVTGIRRTQTHERSNISELQPRPDGILHIHPLARWTTAQVMEYISKYDLPVHPLFDKGYTSIGCGPCTKAVAATDDERQGRWYWTDKTECGLLQPPREHTESTLNAKIT